MKISQQLFLYLSGLYGFNAYAAVFGALLVCGLGVPIPEDVTLLAAGLLASIGNMSLAGAMIIGFVGVLAGDGFLFMLGRKLGYRVFQLPGFRRIFTEDRILKARERIQKDARMICFVARFLPGLRAPIYLTAGVMHVKPSTFLIQDGLAAFVSVPVWVYIGYLFGSNIDHLFAQAKRANVALLITVGAIVLLYVGFKVVKGRLEKR